MLKWIPIIITATSTVLAAVLTPGFLAAHPVTFAVLNGLAQLLHSVLPSTLEK
jgi:hypothetical protein